MGKKRRKMVVKERRKSQMRGKKNRGKGMRREWSRKRGKIEDKEEEEEVGMKKCWRKIKRKERRKRNGRKKDR